MAARAGGHKETFGGPTPHLSLVDEDEREKIQVKREKMKQRMTSMKVEAGLEEDEEVLKQKALEEAARIKQDFKIAQEARVDATGDIAVEDELGDRAYEGFGTVEAANTDKPLVPLMPDRGIILEAMISVTIGTAAETAVRVICTSSMICIGAELDKTYTGGSPRLLTSTSSLRPTLHIPLDAFLPNFPSLSLCWHTHARSMASPCIRPSSLLPSICPRVPAMTRTPPLTPLAVSPFLHLTTTHRRVEPDPPLPPCSHARQDSHAGNHQHHRDNVGHPRDLY
jgi:hypothetical protein